MLTDPDPEAVLVPVLDEEPPLLVEDEELPEEFPEPPLEVGAGGATSTRQCCKLIKLSKRCLLPAGLTSKVLLVA